MIAIGSDHGGYELKLQIAKYLDENSIKYKDFGTYSNKSCDYPDIAKSVCNSLVSGESDKAVLICGTGIGMSIAANKIKGIRAAVCSDYFSAKYSRMHDNANVLCLGARVIGEGIANGLVQIFLDTPYEGGRHQKRVEKISKMES